MNNLQIDNESNHLYISSITVLSKFIHRLREFKVIFDGQTDSFRLSKKSELNPTWVRHFGRV